MCFDYGEVKIAVFVVDSMFRIWIFLQGMSKVCVQRRFEFERSFWIHLFILLHHSKHFGNEKNLTGGMYRWAVRDRIGNGNVFFQCRR